MNILAQLFGLLGLIINIVGIQFKKKRKILITFLLANLIFGISFLFLKGYSGAAICLVAGIQSSIHYIFINKNKKFPLYLIILYIIIPIIIGFFTYKSLIDIFPVFASILFTFSIIQKKERKIRFFTLFNILMWMIYDIIIGAYTAALDDLIFLTSTLIAVYRYDIFKNK